MKSGEQLIGTYAAKLDEKGRLATPKKIRDILGSEIILARWFEGCLLLVDRNSWQEIVSTLTGGELAALSVRDIHRFLLAGSYEIQLDKQGRFIVPQKLRDYANIKVEAVFAGLGDRVEIWATDSWEEREKVLIKEASEKVENLYKEGRKK